VCSATYTLIYARKWRKIRLEHVPTPVETSHEGKVTILWNQEVKTDRIITDNKLDNIISDNEKGKYLLIDTAVFRR
jgi:hypothetical protein